MLLKNDFVKIFSPKKKKKKKKKKELKILPANNVVD